MNVADSLSHGWIQGFSILVATVCLCPHLVCPLVWHYPHADFPRVEAELASSSFV